MISSEILSRSFVFTGCSQVSYLSSLFICNNVIISSITAFCIAPLLCTLYLVASGFSACHSSKDFENTCFFSMILFIRVYVLRTSSGLESKYCASLSACSIDISSADSANISSANSSPKILLTKESVSIFTI